MYTIIPVNYKNHPYLKGTYYRIFDTKYSRFRLGIYTTHTRAQEVLNNICN